MIPVFLILVLAALLGAFGAEVRTVEDESQGLETEVTYPLRFRFKMLEPLTVRVTNHTGQPVTDVNVRVDAGYLNAFSAVAFTPAPDDLTSEWWTFRLDRIEPDTTAVIIGQVQAEDFGLHHGMVQVRGAGLEEVDVTFDTLTFP